METSLCMEHISKRRHNAEDDVEEDEMVLTFPKTNLRGGKKDSVKNKKRRRKLRWIQPQERGHDAHQGRLHRKPRLPHYDEVVGDLHVSTSNTPSF
ncbi:hypothetical protein PsorP6_017577 [Peronosclerospora sorghi]|uniref:Uncharacterized protein n=1 Tax=Peronosclerospora sorghi TaxID=230839 RepID=A0ACC0WML6_9STRA|nr:hypothetical protein PsorP6_017577 [Peronosclerospora sorghi]